MSICRWGNYEQKWFFARIINKPNSKNNPRCVVVVVGEVTCAKVDARPFARPSVICYMSPLLLYVWCVAWHPVSGAGVCSIPPEERCAKTSPRRSHCHDNNMIEVRLNSSTVYSGNRQITPQGHPAQTGRKSCEKSRGALFFVCVCLCARVAYRVAYVAQISARCDGENRSASHICGTCAHSSPTSRAVSRQQVFFVCCSLAHTRIRTHAHSPHTPHMRERRRVEIREPANAERLAARRAYRTQRISFLAIGCAATNDNIIIICTVPKTNGMRICCNGSSV